MLSEWVQINKFSLLKCESLIIRLFEKRKEKKIRGNFIIQCHRKHQNCHQHATLRIHLEGRFTCNFTHSSWGEIYLTIHVILNINKSNVGVYDVYKMKDIMRFSIAYHQQEYDNFSSVKSFK